MSDMYEYNFEREQFIEEYYEVNKKSESRAYTMWKTLGLVGGHRYYFGKINSAIGQLVLLVAVILATIVIRSWWTLALLVLPLRLWIYDFFQIRKWLKENRKELKSQAALKYFLIRKN